MTAPELVWLLEHPPLYTAGTSARDEDLLEPQRLPVHRTGRGGRYTYHGPGQRIAYVMLDLRRRGQDVRCHVHQLEEWIIRTLARFDVRGERRDGRVGIWVARPAADEEKIAAIGVRVRQWVTYHGVALNIDPDLDHYRGIVPCGIAEHGVTSLRRARGSLRRAARGGSRIAEHLRLPSPPPPVSHMTMTTLFESHAPRPLADRLRPPRLDEIVGQDHLLGPGRPDRPHGGERGSSPR